MLDKLFVRVRSWLHIDPTTASPVSASGPAGLAGVPGPSLASSTRSQPSRSARGNQPAEPTPPPLPGEAFSLVMEAQPESGMVITESGIIIIDPNGVDAGGEPGKGHPTSTLPDAWALPNAAAAAPTVVPSRPDSYGDWDTVLARARAQLTPPDKSKTRK
jgi:hypothetical protein